MQNKNTYHVYDLNTCAVNSYFGVQWIFFIYRMSFKHMEDLSLYIFFFNLALAIYLDKVHFQWLIEKYFKNFYF